MKLNHEGKSVHRLKREPLEKAFHDLWMEENARVSGRPHGVLEWLLASNGAEVTGAITQEQATVAATVIQWLGSPVGFGFLEKALAREGYRIVRGSKRGAK